MRYVFALAILASTLIACNQPVKGPNGITYKSAVQYNDYIVGRQSIVVQDLMDFLKTAGTSLDSAKEMLNNYPGKIQGIIEDVKGMPSYKGDSAFRNAAVNLFGFYKRIFGNEYKRVIDMRISGDSETEEGAAEIKRIVDDVTAEEEKYDTPFQNAQAAFASKNNLKLTENDIQKKFDKATGK